MLITAFEKFIENKFTVEFEIMKIADRILFRHSVKEPVNIGPDFHIPKTFGFFDVGEPVSPHPAIVRVRGCFEVGDIADPFLTPHNLTASTIILKIFGIVAPLLVGL
jgi:hypothetical protein